MSNNYGKIKMKMAKLKLSQGKYAIVDDELFEWLNSTRWTYQGTPTGRGYAFHSSFGGGKRERIQLHRLLAAPRPGMEVDHINNDGLDNRLENLRVCTRSQNMMNKPHARGVQYHWQSGKWRAYATKQGKREIIYFETKEEAEQSRREMVSRLFGEFAPQ